MPELIPIETYLGTIVIAIGFICAASYGFYWTGWHKRNLQSNNYLNQQKEEYRELYERSKDKIKNLVFELEDLKLVRDALHDTALSYKEAVEAKNKRIEELETNLLKPGDISRILISESAVLDDKSKVAI